MTEADILGVPRNEETTTEDLVLSLARKYKWNGLEIETYTKAMEGKNGADWAFWFYDGSSISLDNASGVGARVQAKRLYSKRQKYTKLFHQSGSQKISSNGNDVPNQCQVLLSHNDGLVPIYLFYNSNALKMCALLRSAHAKIGLKRICIDCMFPPDWGITVSHAETIKKAKWGKENQPGDFPMIPWHCLFFDPWKVEQGGSASSETPASFVFSDAFASSIAQRLSFLYSLSGNEDEGGRDKTGVYRPSTDAPIWARLLRDLRRAEDEATESEEKVDELEKKLNDSMDEANLRGIAIIGHEVTDIE